ncbi:hypothetical protein ACRB8A_19985 (plasmid) [Arthrobacter sp. G.S.26]|uniref:hypothetical protein n=1 Tax=Arthrobacter sp. G.S.26 TaxID=3433706 RepID=UPI003D7729CB
MDNPQFEAETDKESPKGHNRPKKGDYVVITSVWNAGEFGKVVKASSNKLVIELDDENGEPVRKTFHPSDASLL